MNWLKIDNPEIDGQKLQAEIEVEILQLKKEKKLIDPDPVLEKAFSAFSIPEGDSAFLDMLEAYASGWDVKTLSQRRPLLRPLLPFLVKILKRIFKPQYIFNSLVLEALRNQETRIKSLEERLNHSH